MLPFIPDDPVGREYFRFHAERLHFLLDAIARHCRGAARLLDIGRSPVTTLIAAAFPKLRVESLGFGPAAPGHHSWDLNEAVDPARWPRLEPYEVMVFAETLEHLHTAPTQVMACLATLLRPGGRMILQTPNAAALSKRLRLLLCGENPYEMIRETPGNPGHFREYTLAELREIAARIGFRILETHLRNYFAPRGWHKRLYVGVCRYFPAQFREGITLCLSRAEPR